MRWRDFVSGRLFTYGFSGKVQALGKAALNRLGAAVVADVLEIAKAAWDDWKKSPEERIKELEALIQAKDDDFDSAAESVALQVAFGRPDAERIKLATFLKQFRSTARQSQRSLADPTGRTIRPGFVLDCPDDLAPLIPSGISSFYSGFRPTNNWMLVEKLGAGGFGEVWKATHTYLKSRESVAIKFCTTADAHKLLTHELKVIDRLLQQGPHAGIVTLQDVDLTSNPPFLVYDYIEGSDLGHTIQDWYRQPEKPSIDKITRVILQLVDIIAFAHRLDPPIVHRDLKPSNILVQQLPNHEIAFKITDFGIGGIAASKSIGAGQQARTSSIFLTTLLRGAGSYLYASPEQIVGQVPDTRDDVHALGVIWYQMMTGDLTEGKPSGISWMDDLGRRGMSREMVELLAACFEKAEHRPADAVILAEKIRPLLRNLNNIKAISNVITTSESIRWFELRKKHSLSYFNEYEDAVVRFAPGEQHALSGGRAIVRWDIASGKSLRIYNRVGFVNTFDVCRNGRRAFVNDCQSVPAVLDLETGEYLRRFDTGEENIRCTACSPDGRIGLTGGEKGSLTLWDLSSGKRLYRWDIHGPVDSAMFSRDGNRILSFDRSSFNASVDIWHVEKNWFGGIKSVSKVPFAVNDEGYMSNRFKQDAYVKAVAFSPDGRHVLSAGTELRLWDVDSESEEESVSKWVKLEDWSDSSWYNLNSLAFSADGKLILCCAENMRIWDVNSRREIYRSREFEKEVKDGVFSSDARHVLFSCSMRKIGIWEPCV